MRNAVVVGLFLLAASPAVAESEKPWYQQITVNAFASVSYTWNFNDPLSKINRLRAFDYDHNTFRLDGAELVVQKAPLRTGDWGFRVDLTAGAIARAGAASGLFRDASTGNALDIDIQQAFVSYIIPVGRGLRVDLGKFVTPLGVEVFPGYDGYNDNYSHSWLFSYGPYTHTGLRLNYSFHDWVSASLFLWNGWDNVLDNNAAKSFAAQVALTPGDKFALYLNYAGGPERSDSNSDFRHLLDLVFIYKPHRVLTLMANVDYGVDQNGALVEPDPALMPPPSPLRRDASWFMGVAYVRVQPVNRFGFTVRGELFYDFDGNRTGTAQRLLSATLTPEVKLMEKLILRAEVRYDQSDQFVFERSDGVGRKHQTTVAVNALAFY